LSLVLNDQTSLGDAAPAVKSEQIPKAIHDWCSHKKGAQADLTVSIH